MVAHSYNVNAISRDDAQKSKKIKRKIAFSNVHKYVKEYNENTGIHGLHYLTDNKRSVTEKIVWGIILLTSATGCVWMIYEILKKYQNSPIVIGLANEPGFIHQIPFPAITICPVNKVSNHKFNYENIKLKLKNNTSLTDDERIILYYTRSKSICRESASLYKEDPNYVLNGEGILDVMERVAPTSPLYFCQFMAKKYNCTDIFTRVLTSVGICYSFNVLDRSEIFKKQVFHYENFHQVGRNSSAFDGESEYKGEIGPDVSPKRTLFVGFMGGLHFKLIQGKKDINKFCGYPIKGYLMRIHLPSEMSESGNIYSLPLEESLILSVTPEIIRTSDKIKNYNIEKRKCYLKGERELKYFQIYTQSNCELECLTNITLSKCGCVEFYMPRMNGTEFICTLEQDDCFGKSYKYLHEKILEGIYFGCGCFPLCTELKYNLDILPYDFAIDKKYLKGLSLSTIDIAFKSRSFPVLERNELYGTTDLISNFGGLLGLFTGFSFISLAEIIYFLTLRIWCNRRLYGRWSGPPN